MEHDSSLYFQTNEYPFCKNNAIAMECIGASPHRS